MPDEAEHFNLWHTKLAAWTHDPAEKALVLLRDPAGHEWGTSADLREDIFGQRDVPTELRGVVEQADQWASAADRPQWPRDEKDGRYVQWAQVRFMDDPVLIHPLSGKNIKLDKLHDIPVEHIKKVSRDHFRNLIDSEKDPKKTALAFWRFGPVLREADEIGEFWGLLPADTRVPDHTIWQHLDLTSAFATAFCADNEDNPAMLTVSFGPVQEFIAQARTTSDLWAGSHLLARVAWEGLKVICTEYGPDTVIFPQLRGIPQVDIWLRDEMKLPEEWFENEEWSKGHTDSNPLFAAALPNRFVALVPASEASELAECITKTVRTWVMTKGKQALDQLLKQANIPEVPTTCSQVAAQLDGFPEVHWVITPWRPLTGEGKRMPDDTRLRDALEIFYPERNSLGFLDTKAWKLLSRELEVEGQRFYAPNPGVLYPALYDLLNRSQATAKSVRAFRQLPQEGYRCSLCGEREWLTHERKLLCKPPGKRRETDSLWEKLQGTSWARKGEHLCALCALKRLWPNLYCKEIANALGGQRPNRFVVSTHTMALATSLERWLEGTTDLDQNDDVISRLAQATDEKRVVALPRKLAKHLLNNDPNIRTILRGLPLYLEDLNEKLQSDESDDQEEAYRRTHELDCKLKKVLGHKPEAYYALILMDGDHMGAWLSGQGNKGELYRLSFRKTWHPQLRATLKQRHPEGDLADYLNERRPVSPARHMAISNSLNGFALHVARHIVEDIGKGKLIYAGGDDVLAMVSVDDLLAVMFLLRLAYSGLFPIEPACRETAKKIFTGMSSGSFDLRRGYVRLNNRRLYRMMGDRATASIGAVIAHHQAPLGFVLRKLREAEQRAKQDGGRDAFAISLLKRSGGATYLTCPWLTPQPNEPASWQEAMEHGLEETPMGQLIRLRNRFAGDTFSRRAAYITQGWLTDTPESALRTMLGYQFRQQTKGSPTDKRMADSIGQAVGNLAIAVNPSTENDNSQRESRTRAFVENFLAIAEFLAREGRTCNLSTTGQ